MLPTFIIPAPGIHLRSVLLHPIRTFSRGYKMCRGVGSSAPFRSIVKIFKKTIITGSTRIWCELNRFFYRIERYVHVQHQCIINLTNVWNLLSSHTRVDVWVSGCLCIRVYFNHCVCVWMRTCFTYIFFFFALSRFIAITLLKIRFVLDANESGKSEMSARLWNTIYDSVLCTDRWSKKFLHTTSERITLCVLLFCFIFSYIFHF